MVFVVLLVAFSISHSCIFAIFIAIVVAAVVPIVIISMAVASFTVFCCFILFY